MNKKYFTVEEAIEKIMMGRDYISMEELSNVVLTFEKTEKEYEDVVLTCEEIEKIMMSRDYISMEELSNVGLTFDLNAIYGNKKRAATIEGDCIKEVLVSFVDCDKENNNK
jgi:hypothetical protein